MTELNETGVATALSSPPDVDKTPQQIFDECVEHLARQGRPAVDGGGCRYRTEGGDMCAFGIFIPDDAYRPEFEGCKASQIIDRGSLPSYMAANRALFDQLQWAHDANSKRDLVVWLDNLPIRLRAVAERFDLDASSVGRHFKTAQQVFDECVEHLAKQGGPAVTENGLCMYRAPSGRQCAVGHFIPDDAYVADMESTNVRDLVEKHDSRLPAYLKHHQRLLHALQHAHDYSRAWAGDSVWRSRVPEKLREVAGSYSLDASAVDKHFPVPA